MGVLEMPTASTGRILSTHTKRTNNETTNIIGNRATARNALTNCTKFFITSCFIVLLLLLAGENYAQHLFSVGYNELSQENAKNVKKQIEKSEASISFMTKSADKDSFSFSLTTNKNTKIIFLNEENGNNVVITPTEKAPIELLINSFFMEELKKSVLGEAERYLVIESCPNLTVRNVSIVSNENKDVFIPQYFYGPKENVKEALPKDRQIVNIFKEKPRLIPTYPDDPENLRYVAQLEEEMSYYVYMYKLPDGTLCIYDEHFKPNKEEDEVSTRTGTSLQFNLSGSNLNDLRQSATLHALGIWSEILDGTVPIDINVSFVNMGAGILGGSYFQPHYYNPETQTWYCSALGNQLAGYNVTPNMRDIRIEMNSYGGILGWGAINWYYGTTGTPSSNQYDWITITLHEVTHGLGFSNLIRNDGSYYYTTNSGSFGTYTEYPGIYDRQLYQGTSGSNLTELSQSQRASLVTSNDLYAGRPGSFLLAANGGNRVRMYAPSVWSGGSSVSHWDNSVTFPTFMKYAAATEFRLTGINEREIAFMLDMGWVQGIEGLINWTFQNGTLTIGCITNSCAMPNYSYTQLSYGVAFTAAPWVVHRPSINNVVIENGVSNIGTNAFRGCFYINSVTIPNSVISIGNYAFCDTDLQMVDIPNSVKSIGDWAFYGCAGLESLTIGNSVESIGLCAFQDCFNITSINIPNSVTFLGNQSFSGCSSLQFVTIPNTVTSLGNHIFSYCSSLTSVIIPNSVTSIGYWAFGECTNLNMITSKATIPPAVQNNTFSGVPPTSAIYVPCGSVSAYQTAWSYFSNFIGVPMQGSCGPSLSWILDCNGTITISGNGEMQNYDHYWNGGSLVSSAPWYPLRNSINTVIIENGVSNIGSNAFFSCRSLESVTIPNSVTSIEDSAFNGCSSLFSVTIPNSVTSIGVGAFGNCHSLFSMTIPDSIISIGDYAFAECWGLESVTIGNSVETIGESAFEDCLSLIKITIPNSVISVDYWAFYNCSSLESVNLGNSLESIGWGAFGDCHSLISITIPNSVTYIGDWAFEGCWSLESVIISNSVNSLGNHLFSNCSSLFSVIIPDSVTSIGNNAFSDCSSLESLTIGNSVVTIGDWAFSYCQSLSSVTIPNSVTSLGDWAFYYCSSLESLTIGNSVTYIGRDAFYNCSSLESVTLGNSLETIEGGAFNECYDLKTVNFNAINCDTMVDVFFDCPNLEQVNIGSEVIKIPDSAFWGLSGLTSITIPNSVKTIGDFAFAHCDGLESVTIGNSVVTIGNLAFAYCSNLNMITSKAAIPPAAVQSSNTFSGVPPTAVIYVPCGTATAYQTAWSHFSNFIEVPMQGNCGPSLSWILDCNGTLTISGNGEMPDYDSLNFASSAPWYSYRNSINSVIIEDGVTSIGSCAFPNCSSLESVIIGNSVLTIGGEAFDDCGSLESVTIGNSLEMIGSHAFSYCGSLISITFPNSVISIGDGAFYGCDSLTTIAIPSLVTSIENYAFGNCSSITAVINLSGNPQIISDNVFYNLALSNVTLQVRGKSIPLYQNTVVWQDFGQIIYDEDFLVTFEPQNGDANFLEYVYLNEMVEIPENPSKEHYTFNGWYKEGVEWDFNTPITEDITLSAQYNPINYTITYVLNGGTNHPDNPENYNIESPIITLQEPKKDGYSFVGWVEGNIIESGSIGNRTFTAKWEIVNYVITYELNGGTNNPDNPEIYTIEDYIELNPPIKEGYTGSWQEGSIIELGTIGELTFTAQWTLINYSITYILNGGSNNPDNPVTYTIEDYFELKNSNHECYIFEGWAEGNIIELGTIGDLTFNAQWSFIAVDLVTNVPTDAIEGVPLTLTGTVEPNDASYQTIIWKVESQGTTGAVINGNLFYTVASGRALISANIENGSTECSVYKEIFIINVGNVGIDKLKTENGKLIIYPNPTQCELRVESGEWRVENEAYSIFNSVGQLVMQGVLKGKTLNVKPLATGIYYLKMGDATLRFVKK